MDWKGRSVLVTGGASFIGSHLVDAMVDRGARVRVVDDLSSGRLTNIKAHVAEGSVEFINADLSWPGVAEVAVEDIDTVFHLAADHGGRGYVDRHQTACASNLVLDGLIFRACQRARVGKVVYASSGCVYPNNLQNDPGESPLPDRRSGRPALRRRQHVWLGKAADPARLLSGVRPEVCVLSILHCVREPGTREPRGNRHDCSGIRRPGSVRRLGYWRAGAQLDARK